MFISLGFFPSVNVQRSKITKFESIVHFHHTSSIDKYLGFPMILGMDKKNQILLLLWIKSMAG